MPNRGAVLAVLISLTVAFLWGFKRDLISSLFASAPAAVSPAAPAESNPFGSAPVQPAGMASNSSAPAPAFPGPPVRANNLSNTLDSIRPGQIPPAQVTQRNEYFEKLSQQLRELQGGTPPPPSVPNEGPPPLPPPGAPQVDHMIPGIPPAFPGAGQTEPGAEAGVGAQAMPQVDFDQQTPRVEDDEEADSADDEDSDADAEVETP